jgi:transglutaminase-like putative cysteine protease
MRWGHWLFIAVLLAVPLVTGAYKVLVLDYRVATILPETEYRVSVDMSLDGNLSRVRSRTFLPMEDHHQRIEELTPASNAAFRFSERHEDGNRVGSWFGTSVADGTAFGYTFRVRLLGQRYRIDPTMEVPETYPPSVTPYLKPTEAIQVDDPEIVAKLEAIGADRGTLIDRIDRIYDFTEALPSRPFSGLTDARTALRLGEASCNGKSRLFVAMARASGIPSRLVGGLILETGSKRTSHQWVEVYAGGYWVPYDPTNGYRAELPPNFLVLYRGDHALFRHTADVNFDYGFTIRSRQVPAARALETFRAFNVWALFERLGIPFALLRTVLMLPIGALIVVVFRNVIGVPTFGTFLPALIAAAAAEPGLLWGLVSICLVMLVVAAARLGLQRFGLLHSPTLAILLAVVVITMLGATLVAERLGIEGLTRITYFPIAVMAIASERFYLALVEQGPKRAGRDLLGTLIVVLSCYLVMNSTAMQVLVSGFPEVLLWVVAANAYLGRWVGVRLLEWMRFREAIASGTDRASA